MLPVYSSAVTISGSMPEMGVSGEKKSISIVSDRESGDLKLRFESDKDAAALIIITDGSGTTVIEQPCMLRNTVNSIPLKKATALPEGNYTVRLLLNGETYTTRFLVWK
jgi:hypothetical protein